MKVKTWVRKQISSYYIDNEKVRKLLLDNGIYHLNEYKEEILDIPEEEIIDDSGYPQTGFWYTNTLWDLVHDKSKFRSELDDLEYEIIEEGYPYDVPWCDIDIYDVKDFRKWMLEKGKEEEECEEE